MKWIEKYVFLTIGAFLAAIALEIFLVPNNIIDGGITGISIMLSYLTKIPLGAYIFVLNLPFLLFGYRQIGKSFVLSTFYAVSVLSLSVTILEKLPPLTYDTLLASVFGGIILGIGVGLVIRHGGSMDGTEIVAVVFSEISGFSVGEIVLFINVFVLGSAGIVFTWDRAMYSLITYFIAFKVIDLTIEGLDEKKAVMIITEKPEEIVETITARLGRSVTFWEGKGGYTREKKGILYAVVSRLEIAKLKSIVKEHDEGAFVTIHDVYDILGGQFRKRSIH
ncbi:membrane protein [Caldanaerobacter subterraneus subsp. yonseiensis KB-1]|uniref:Membrane protein n=1 Tax=Caldanaerobacter subterraneus subsp. yonseiensis KB-1 TaxID=1388761 RepID=U5CWN9_CALSX|nr:YitT family protein [Caldanaerobacter subterraneus]ERM92457.1 membrane protein [Caldanaerobacter subterraneus subsp. yonseiensis KB-1]